MVGRNPSRGLIRERSNPLAAVGRLVLLSGFAVALFTLALSVTVLVVTD